MCCPAHELLMYTCGLHTKMVPGPCLRASVQCSPTDATHIISLFISLTALALADRWPLATFGSQLCLTACSLGRVLCCLCGLTLHRTHPDLADNYSARVSVRLCNLHNSDTFDSVCSPLMQPSTHPSCDPSTTHTHNLEKPRTTKIFLLPAMLSTDMLK